MWQVGTSVDCSIEVLLEKMKNIETYLDNDVTEDEMQRRYESVELQNAECE